ncbi:unnamed protein product [Arabidopsis halleri]
MEEEEAMKHMLELSFSESPVWVEPTPTPTPEFFPQAESESFFHEFEKSLLRSESSQPAPAPKRSSTMELNPSEYQRKYGGKWCRLRWENETVVVGHKTSGVVSKSPSDIASIMLKPIRRAIWSRIRVTQVVYHPLTQVQPSYALKKKAEGS